VVGICCGLRPGERTGLVWDDIELIEGVIRVRHSLKALPGPDGHLVLQLAELKTEKSRRTLALPRYAVATLRALKTAQAADKLRLGPLYSDQGLVFCRPDGRPYWREAIRLGFRRVCKLAGIGEDWTPRELRHSFVSVLSDAGWISSTSPTRPGTPARRSPARCTGTRSATRSPGRPRRWTGFSVPEARRERP
jgi:integrase